MASLVDSAAHAITYEAVPLHRFSGQRGEDIELWLQSFTMHQTAQAWSDVYIISIASLHLDGGTRRWSFQFNKAMSWSAFQCNMLKQYGDSQTVSWLRLQNCRQQAGQSVSVFAQSVSVFAQTLRLRMDKVAYPIDEQGKMFLSKLQEGILVHFLNYNFPDLLNLLSFDEAVQLAEYVELHDSLPSSRPIEPALPSVAMQPAPCYAYTNHTSMITASTVAMDSNKAPAQALMAMQSCELLKSTALQLDMQEDAHVQLEETVGEISLPLSLEQMGGKQEQQCAPQSHADKVSSGVLCTDETVVEVRQALLECKQEEVPKRLTNKVAAPLLSKSAGRASGSSFNFKRALQWANGPLEHKGQTRSQALVQPLKSSQGLPCLPDQVCAMAMAESNQSNVKVDLENQPTPEAVSRVSAPVTQEDSKSGDRPEGISSLARVPVTAAQGDTGTDTAGNAHVEVSTSGLTQEYIAPAVQAGAVTALHFAPAAADGPATVSVSTGHFSPAGVNSCYSRLDSLAGTELEPEPDLRIAPVVYERSLPTLQDADRSESTVLQDLPTHGVGLSQLQELRYKSYWIISNTNERKVQRLMQLVDNNFQQYGYSSHILSILGGLKHPTQRSKIVGGVQLGWDLAQPSSKPAQSPRLCWDPGSVQE